MLKPRHWVGIAALGTAVLAIPLLWSANRAPVENGRTSAMQETHIKNQVLQQDMHFTERLFAMDARRDIDTALEEWHGQTPKQMNTLAEEFIQAHPHFIYMKWIDSGKGTEWVKGKLPKDESRTGNQKLAEQLKIAESSVKKQESYVSPQLTIKGKHHIVMGIPAPGRQHAIVALVNQHVVQTVRKLQQKNLRLVPYPPESKFRVKSVDADSMRDVKVKDGEDNAGTSHYYENEVVVRFRDEPTPEALKRMMRETGSEEPRRHRIGATYVFRSHWMTAEQMTQYFAQYDPLYVEPHFLYMTNGESRPTSILPLVRTEPAGVAVEEPNDVLYKPYQWNLPSIQTNRGWSISKGADNVIIGIVDTGVDLKHHDLKGRLLNGYNVFDPGAPPQDDVGHGTHVAGIIGANVNNREGVAGMTWVNPILPVKALDSTGSGTTYSVAEGIIWATDNGAKVINLSLGNYVDGAFLHDAVKYAFDRDVVLIAATGNDNTKRPGYPAAYPEVFAVSATDADDKRASYSNYGNYVDVVAPGTSIASTYPNNQYAALSGTSMASPHVTALAALIRSINPGLKNTEVYEIMRQSATDLGTPGKDIDFGYGKIDVARALSMAEQGNSSLSLYPQNIERKLNRFISRFIGM